jgi:hypothetical protein
MATRLGSPRIDFASANIFSLTACDAITFD